MDNKERISRRSFIETLAGGAALVGIGTAVRPWTSWASGPQAAEAMPVRPLGKTGHQVRLFSLGGQATLEESGTDDESAAIIHGRSIGCELHRYAAAYGDGTSETYIAG